MNITIYINDMVNADNGTHMMTKISAGMIYLSCQNYYYSVGRESGCAIFVFVSVLRLTL